MRPGITDSGEQISSLLTAFVVEVFVAVRVTQDLRGLCDDDISQPFLSFSVNWALHRCWCWRVGEWMSHNRKVLRIVTVDNMTFLYKYFITAIAYCSLGRTTLYIQTGAGHIYEVNCVILTKSNQN